MMIYPTIELQNGRCVSLAQGRIDEPMIWHVDPVKTARGFADAGAEWMHLTDLDAIEGNYRNAALVEKIIRSAEIPVQLAGGFRTQERVEQWIDRGAGRIVIATLAARDPNLVRKLAQMHADQIVLAVDVLNGKLMTDGWQSTAAITPEAFLQAFEDVPLAGVLLTDITSDRQDDQADGHLSVITQLAALTRHPVIASGIVRTVDDISRLKYVRSVEGALVGRALFRKTIDIHAALAAARPDREKTAAFI